MTDTEALASDLVIIEAHYGRKRQLARVLTTARARRQLSALAGAAARTHGAWDSSPLGRSDLDPLWADVAALNDAIRQLDRDDLRRLCRRTTGCGEEASFLMQLWFGPDGLFELVERENSFLRARRALGKAFDDGCAGALANQTARFAADLLRDGRAFRRALRELRAVARMPIVVRRLGFGEISRPVALERGGGALAHSGVERPVVYKRLPPFASRAEAELYVAVYERYNTDLRDRAGLSIPSFGAQMRPDGKGRTIVYCLQARLDPEALGKEILRRRSADQCLILFRMVLSEYRKVIRFNRNADGVRLGIDGQIPNWVVRGYAGDGAPLRGDEGLWFIDTNTPLMRAGGVDCLPMKFYLRGMPPLLRPFVRPMARKVLDRYFDPRTILLDFLANVSIHGRSDLVDLLLPEANAFLAEGLIEPAPPPYTRAEIERYIEKDIATWRLLRSIRELEAVLERRQSPVAMVRKIREIYRRPLFE